jgi:hypothetical protein
MNHNPDESIKCTACKKPIKFITTKAGNQMPVEAEMKVAKEETDKGTFFMVNGTMQTGIKPGQCYYVPHWGTCTTPDKFRKEKTNE